MKRNKNLEITVLRAKPDIKTGLNSVQVAERISAGATNKTKNTVGKSYAAIFLGNIFTFFNLLGLGIMLLVLVLGSYQNLAFAVIILANTAIGIVQEIRAKKMIEKLSLVTQPTAKVVRNSQIVELPIADVVLDDIVKYANGNQICADGVVVDGSLEVNESLLTGEAVAIKKEVGDTVFSGSFVVSGTALCRAEKVGLDSYSAQLAAKAKKYVKPKSELMNAINAIIKVLAIIIFPLGIGTFLMTHFVAGNTVVDSLIKMSGSMIGMIPSGMVLLTSVALAVSVLKLAQNKALVQDLYCIEMLARVDTLCLDKTGTITDGTMTVETVLPLGQEKNIEKYIAMFNYALKETNLTATALGAKFGEDNSMEAKRTIAFSSARKFSAVQFDFGTLALGATGFVCKTDDKLNSICEEYIKKGMRVLVLCKSLSEIKDNTLPEDIAPIALIVLSDTIRTDAPATIAWFAQNNVDIKVISGDNAQAVSVIAAKAGVKNAEKYISLFGLSDQEVIEAASKYSVFGRVLPEQKALLIKTFKNNGRTVAMTGDGVNDILAMKEADCAVAMAEGSQASKSVAHLVLTNSNFSSMPKVVAEGRQVVNNIQNSSSLFLMKTTMTVFTTILMLIMCKEYPFAPSHLYLIEVLVIGLPSFFLALRPNNQLIKGKFISNTLLKTIPSGGGLSLAVLIVYLYSLSLPLSSEQITTICTLAMTISGSFALAVMCFPYGKITAVVTFGSMACVGIAFCIPFIRNIMGMVDISAYWQIPAICVAVAIVVIVAGRFIYDYLSLKAQKKSNNGSSVSA